MATLIQETVEAHEAQFARHGVTVDLDLGSPKLRVRAVKGMIVRILENLISNSLYWMDMRAQRDPKYRPKSASHWKAGRRPLHTKTTEEASHLPMPTKFPTFFSLKETNRRRGLGLYIAQDAAEHHGGTLRLSEHINPETGRIHRFILELPLGTQE